MSWSDPIADMLTRVRNAQAAGHQTVDVPHSRLKGDMARVLKREGYLADYTVEPGNPRQLRLFLKYTADGAEPVIRGIKRRSRPGLRSYVQVGSIPRVLGGQGMAMLSTSQGVLSDREARTRGIGGEVLCLIW